MIIDSPIISGSHAASGSLNQHGDVVITGSLTVTGTINGSITGSITTASYALNAETLDGLDSTSFTTTSSFNTVSGSFSTRVTNLESFSSSLDATFATDAQLTAVSQSFSSSLSTVSGSLASRVANNEATGSSLTTTSGSFSTRVTNTEATASSLVTASGSFSTRTTNLETASGSFSTRTTNLETASGSFSTRVTNNESNISSLQTASGSFSTRTTNLETASGSFSTRTTNLETASGSFSTRVTSAEGSVTSLNSKTGSYATTGSNIFVNTQYISAANNAISFTSTASLYTDGGLRVTKDMYVSGTSYFNNVTVYGTQSVQYITSSQLNISTNIISVNTDTPTIRFGGLSVYDSGSTGLTGSMLWDSEDNQWIYSNPSGSTYDSAVFLAGPRNSGVLGNEPGISCNFLSKGNGLHHMTSSGIFEDGSRTCFYGTSFISSSGAACFASQVCSPTFDSNCARLIGKASASPYANSSWLQAPSSSGMFIVNSGITNWIGVKADGSIDSNGIFTHGGTFCTNGAVCSPTGLFSGCVGIGTASPSHLLHARKDQNSYTWARIENQADNSSAYAGLQLGAYGNSWGLAIGSSLANGNSLNFLIDAGGANTSKLTLFATGIACFASTICSPTLVINNQTNISPDANGTGQLMIQGNGYQGYTALDATAMYVGHNSQVRNLTFQTNETNRLTINGDGIACFSCQICAPVSVVTGASIVSGCLGVGTVTPRTKAEFSSGLPTSIPTYTNTTNGIVVSDGGDIYGRIGVSNFSAGGNGYPTYIQAGDYSGAIYYNLLLNPLGGNVGIGTTAPAKALTVVNTAEQLRLSYSSGVYTDFRNDSAGGLLINTSDGYIINYIGGNAKMRINPDSICFACQICAPTAIIAGAVGIGVTSPTQCLEVSGIIKSSGASNSIMFTNRNCSTATWEWYSQGTPGSGFAGLYKNHNTSGTPLVITDCGLVGIGTTSPAYKLDVQGGNLNVQGANAFAIIGDTTSYAAGVGGALYLYGNYRSVGDLTAAGYIKGSKTNSTNNDYGFDLIFGNQTNLVGVTEKMRITSTGNVGIGCTSPGAQLVVYGACNGDTTLHVQNGSVSGKISFSNNTANAIYGGGWWGYMGYSSATYHNFGQCIYAPSFALPSNGCIFYCTGAGYNGIIKLWDSTNGNMVFQNASGGTGDMIFLPQGKIGIGTTSPDAIFHVAKASSGGVGGQIVIDNPASSTLDNTVEISFLTDAGASGAGTRNARMLVINENAGNGAARMEFHTWNGSTSAARMTILSGGNIGIGTTNPNETLDVSGTIQVRGNSVGYATTQCVTQLDFYTGAARLLSFGGNSTTCGCFRFYSAGQNNAGGSDVATISGGGVACFRGAVCTPRLHINTPDGCGLTLQYGANSGYAGISTDSANSLIFKAYIGNEYMRISCAGRVGIGLTSPTAYLHVCGNNCGADISCGGGNPDARGIIHAQLSNSSQSTNASVTVENDAGIGQFMQWTSFGMRIGSRIIKSTNCGHLHFTVGQDSNTVTFHCGGPACFANHICVGGNIIPISNGSQDLGSSSLRWCTVYTSDLSLNNGIGNYTIVEGENDLFLYNNNSCKVFKFVVQEVCPEIAPAKRST